jgi:hypothetical protein
MRRWFALPLLIAALAFLGEYSPPNQTYAKPPKDNKDKKEGKEKEKKGKEGKDKGGPTEKAGKDLNKAYNTLTDVTTQVTATREKLPHEMPRLLDQAKDIYRTARKSYDDRDQARAGELAKAANDAGRGLHHVLRATLPPVAGLPAPPPDAGPGPKGGPPRPGAAPSESEAASATLQRAHDRLREAVTDTTRSGSLFLDAGRDAYDRARRAYLDRAYQRAVELARAAEAWSHVDEHLARGRFEDRLAPPPDGRSGPRGGATDIKPPPPPLPSR